MYGTVPAKFQQPKHNPSSSHQRCIGPSSARSLHSMQAQDLSLLDAQPLVFEKTPKVSTVGDQPGLCCQ
jgi:hypothetical protein